MPAPQGNFPCSSVGKQLACDAGDCGSIPGLGRSPGEGNGNSLQYSCLENPMDRGAWWATAHGVIRVRHDLGLNHQSVHCPSGPVLWLLANELLSLYFWVWSVASDLRPWLRPLRVVSQIKQSCGSCVWEPCWLSKLDVLKACLSRAVLISWGAWCEVQMFCFSGRNSRFWVLSNCGSPWWGWKVKVLVTQSCPTLCNLVDCSPPGSSIHGILQARIPEWVAIPLFRGSSQPRDRTQVCCIAGRFFTMWATREALVGVGWGSWRN